jgi:hypothetical protein
MKASSAELCRDQWNRPSRVCSRQCRNSSALEWNRQKAWCKLLLSIALSGLQRTDRRTTMRLIKGTGTMSLVIAGRYLSIPVLAFANAIILHAPATIPDWQKAAGGSMAFEVASVRPSEGRNFGSFPLNAENSYRQTGGLLTASEAGLLRCLRVSSRAGKSFAGPRRRQNGLDRKV